MLDSINSAVYSVNSMKILDVPRSGSYGGITSSHNRFGQYVRNRRAPVQPIGSGRRAVIRSAFGAASSAFAGLTAEQQAAWDSYAADHPVTNSLGASVTLTGHQMYVAINTQLINIGSAQSAVPPVSDSVETPTGVELTLDASTPEFTVAFDAVPANTKFLVAASPQLSAGRRFTNTFTQFTIADAAATDAEISTDYSAFYGTLTAGRKVFAKVTPVNQYGVTGVPIIIPGKVVA